MYTIPFKTAHQYDGLVGSKAKNLSYMLNHGLPVPDGFVITMDAFNRCLEENSLDINEKRLDEKLHNIKIPETVAKDIEHNFNELLKSYHAAAVRSSSAAEDLEGASFAGQYETYLNIAAISELFEKLKACWASMFTEQVMKYLETVAADLKQLSMGVVVQGLVHSDISGVMFSANPITQNQKEIMINSSYGLGEAIVSGIVTPDQFIVNKETMAIQKEKGLKETKMIPSDEGIETLQTTDAEQGQFSITDRQAKNLAELAIEVEKLYGHPVDIEFGIQDDKIYLLQARPITAI
ncbi:phosphoenolpyruvate synthase/pyruvate phosphate dikinase [Scopulibacillus daqui]|uniref:Phosphoenolpyruvate synthase n=1 Tax=Scopulibacillus daqui TaxID=1469162 RepID=A0ABS2Q0T8_9BACL|nr:PEP/pyruvate-binding domain-containing protein [Scopulibacillus daqui]MBM7645914.1 phosphoenolpyruvate synthase/pyruvate phosphate dikinase [Scopulibacillus daqui]